MTLVATRQAAFFDVDETLITVQSIFRFLPFALGSESDRAERQLRALSAAGVSRREVNRAYFRRFAGRGEVEMGVLGARWFEAERRRGPLFNREVLAALHRHAAASHLTVLVSGSFPACLDPIARFVGADAVLCSRPELRDGRYTGEIAVPMIGSAKATAVRTWAAAQGVELAASSAYGDHASDLPVLAAVGTPVVVGDDPVLAGHAAKHGWAHVPTGDRT